LHILAEAFRYVRLNQDMQHIHKNNQDKTVLRPVWLIWLCN